MSATGDERRMRLTVATAVLNASGSESFAALERCVRSVDRLGGACEHVIYDGGSTDGTVERLRELERETPTLRVFSEPDGGIYEALNKCLARAQGSYFHVLGADDWLLEPERVSACLDRAEREGLDLLMARVELDDGSVSPAHHDGIFCCHQGLFMSTGSLRAQGGFDASYRISADYKSVMRAHRDLLRIATADAVVAHFAGSGVSCGNQGMRRAEFLRAKAEVFGRTEPERDAILATGAIPLGVCRALLRSPSPSTRRLGRKLLFGRLVYRKIRSADFSRRYLFGIPLMTHRRR